MTMRVTGRISPGKIFTSLGLNNPDAVPSSELQEALRKLQNDQAAAVNKLSELKAARIDLLLTDGAIEDTQKAIDAVELSLEKISLLIGPLEEKITAATEREQKEQEAATRKKSSDRLRGMADELETQGPKMIAGLQRFRVIGQITDSIGATFGTEATIDGLVGVLSRAKEISEQLRAQSDRVLSGKGPAELARPQLD
jgi:uncharacterized protein YPO0396